ncbi:uncharacterized protein LOC135817461 isoform X1 [Sycon ciliatum]|uniref:uncharacterized protein LOC135817461 isoform X1 n=1 Tax=Sycon ciliatum TaxID=27933 RepID=UPI0031F61E56
MKPGAMAGLGPVSLLLDRVLLYSLLLVSATEGKQLVQGHNRFATLDITSANVPSGRKWTSTAVLSLGRGRSSPAAAASTGPASGSGRLPSLSSSTGTSPHVLLFGGTAQHTEGGTWLYDVLGNSWWKWPAMADWAANLLSPAPRYGHTGTSSSLPADSSAQLMVMFAGRNVVGYNDLWLFLANRLEWMPLLPWEDHWPMTRWLHTSVFIGTQSRAAGNTVHRFLVFGGNTDGNTKQQLQAEEEQIIGITALNDLWLLEITAWADDANYTATWKQVEQDNSTGKVWPGARASHVAVWANNRQSMIVIGGEGNGFYYSDIWEYTYTVALSGAWKKLVPDFPGQQAGQPYYQQTATYWEAASCVVLFGGVDMAMTRALWIYCFNSGRDGIWSLLDTQPSLTIPPSMSGMDSVLIGQRMYLFAGYQDNDKEISLSQPWSLYLDQTAAEGVWFQLAPPQIKPNSRRSHTAVSTSNSTMVVYGGATTDIEWPRFSLESNNVWVLNITAGYWTKYSQNNGTVGVDVPIHRAAHSAVQHGSYMYVFAGVTMLEHEVELLDDMWQWSLITHTWQRFEPATVLRPTARRSHTAIATSEGMLVFGGISNITGEALQDLWEFSFESSSWTPLANSSDLWPSRRFGHTAVPVADNMVVFGGVNLGQRVADPSVWRYLTANATWERLSDTVPTGLSTPYFHSASSYGNKMIITGGCNINRAIWEPKELTLDRLSCLPQYQLDFPTSVWMFDTLTASWEQLSVEDAVGFRIMHTTVMLGNVLTLYGGYNNDQLHPPKRELIAMRPGCNVGHFSWSLYRQSCSPCPQGTYSATSGVRRCTECPTLTTTVAGSLATNLLNCTECKAPACHGHGTCSASLPEGQVVCKCVFGYISSDMCQNPVYYYLIFFALFGLIVIVAGILFMVRVRRMLRLQQLRAKKLRTSRCELARLTQAWYIEESELAVRERIDAESPGSFGTVVLAEYREMPVAVKHLHKHVSSPRNEREFEEEVRFMRRLRHPNIVLFLGGGKFSKTSTIGPGGVSFLVMEYMQRGTLASLLRNDTVHIDTCQSLRFALDAAKGMRFLHSRNPPCIHRDLKSSNLLVSERWVVKVADFGEACPLFKLHRKGKAQKPSANKRAQSPVGNGDSGLHTRLLYGSSLNSGLDVSVEIQASMGEDERSALLREGSCELSSDVGTLMWQAPEMLRKQPYGPSADVYSFAIVLWEIAARKVPYRDMPSLTSIMKYVLAGNRPAIPSDCPSPFAELMVKCWHDDGKERPTFHDIVANLDSQLESWSP